MHTLYSGPCVLKILGSSVLSIILLGSRSLCPALSERWGLGPDTRSLVFPMMPSLHKHIMIISVSETQSFVCVSVRVCVCVCLAVCVCLCVFPMMPSLHKHTL